MKALVAGSNEEKKLALAGMVVLKFEYDSLLSARAIQMKKARDAEQLGLSAAQAIKSLQDKIENQSQEWQELQEKVEMLEQSKKTPKN